MRKARGEMRMARMNDAAVRAQLRSASGRTSKVIKVRQSVEAAVDVPKVGRLTLSVDSEGQHALRAFPEGRGAPSSIPLTTGEMPTAEHEPD
jgi:hypothetical protein